MSKYYRHEDVIRKRAEDLADKSYWEYGNPKNVDEWIEVAEMEFEDLPTIEVSEEVLKATKNFNAYTIADETAEMGMRTEIEPIIEVSEDCISREWIISFIDAGHLRNPNEKCYSENDVVELIKNAPSVVPSEDCISRAEVIAEFERRKDKLYEDDYFDELMWIIENITDVVPSRAEGEWEIASDDDGEYGICPICGKDADFTHYGKPYLYCPNCGAKMKGAEEWNNAQNVEDI